MPEQSTLPSDVLDTNFVAEACHISEVHMIVNNFLFQIDAVEDEIADVKAQIRRKSVRLRTLRELRTRQRALRKTMTQYEGLLSPMRAVPPEILSEIFLHCLPPPGTSIGSVYAPLLLTRVCRRWREVAFSTRRLWTSLTIGRDIWKLDLHAYMRKCSFHSDPVRITEMWLERSGSLPLDIQVHVHDWVHGFLKSTGATLSGRDINGEVMQKLIANVHRWRHFKATLFTHTIQETFLSDAVMRAPMLESFHLCDPGSIGDPVFIDAPKGLDVDAPRLVDFSFEIPTITISSFRVNFSLLRRLALNSSSTHFPLEKYLQVLEQCPSLECLDTTLDTELQASAGPPRVRISLPRLQELHLNYHNPLNVPLFVKWLDVPRLRILQFTYIGRDLELCEDLWVAFHALITRSRPPLRELSLSMPSSARFLTPILQAVPMLEILDFYRFSPSPATLKALTPTRKGPWLCPRLGALYLVKLANLDVKKVIALVKARVPPDNGAWDGTARPVEYDELETENIDLATSQRNYLIELGVWNAKGVGCKEEKRLLDLGRKGGDRMKFKIQSIRLTKPIASEEENGGEANLALMTGREFRASVSVSGR